ncbi:MAG: vWA domain-containing protein [Pirellulales bacterium]
MEFRDPQLLLLILLTPLLFITASRSASAVRFSSLNIPDRAGRSWRVRVAFLPAALSMLAVASLAVAMAGPRTPHAQTKVTREGIAIMAVIDHSGSMRARDLVKNDLNVDRLSVVKDVFREFVLGGKTGRGRPDDSIGLIAFARYADSLCPLTLDHGNLVSMVDDLEIVNERDEDGTALGDGLALAVERLRESAAKSKVAILLTDGMNNAGAVEPGQAAELAASQKIKVYCIGAGTDGLAPAPFVDRHTGRRQLRPKHVKIDEEALQEIAEKTGGRYFRATDKDSLAGIYAVIDRLERTKISEVRYLEYTEHYKALVLAALGLMAAAAVAKGSLFRTLP